jgi:hypothetical protein
MKRTVKISILFAAFWMLSYSVFSQYKEGETIISKTSEDAYCELNRVYFEALVREQSENSEKLFVISRLGKIEQTKWAHNRLAFAKAYLTQVMPFDEKKSVFAIGEKTDSVGKLEFYLGSKLFLVIEQPKNELGCFSCCEEYVPKKTKRKTKKIRN